MSMIWKRLVVPWPMDADSSRSSNLSYYMSNCLLRGASLQYKVNSHLILLHALRPFQNQSIRPTISRCGTMVQWVQHPLPPPLPPPLSRARHRFCPGRRACRRYRRSQLQGLQKVLIKARQDHRLLIKCTHRPHGSLGQ